MYSTQGSFFGKTGPIDPQRKIPENPKFEERYYPNRWMEEQNLRSMHKRVSTTGVSLTKEKFRGTLLGEQQSENLQLNVHNQKYLSIVYELIKPEHVWKLFKWVDNISEEHKKGLRVIKTVLDIKGAKRFKKNGAASVAVSVKDGADPFSSGAFDPAKAKDDFRKMTQRTSYRTQFGEPPKAAEDFMVLKNKKFKQLEIAQFIQPNAASYIEKWITLNNQDEFTKRIYFTIRDMHSIVRNLEPSSTTATNFFNGRKADKAPRFDKILEAAKYSRDPKARSTNARDKYVTVHNHLADLLKGQTEMKRIFPSEINTKEFKQDFLRGQPYDITHYCELKDPKTTFYQSTMKGKHHDDKAKIISFERESCGHGGVIPDPTIMMKNSMRLTGFSTDLKQMQNRQFTYTGDSWNVGN